MTEPLIKQIYNLITSEYPELKKEEKKKSIVEEGWYNIYLISDLSNLYQLGNRAFASKEEAIKSRDYENYIATGYISQIE